MSFPVGMWGGAAWIPHFSVSAVLPHRGVCGHWYPESSGTVWMRLVWYLHKASGELAGQEGGSWEQKQGLKCGEERPGICVHST